jgi:hypothetical protein
VQHVSSNKGLRHSAKQATWLPIKSGHALLTCIQMTSHFWHMQKITLQICWGNLYAQVVQPMVWQLSSKHIPWDCLRNGRRFRNIKVEIHVFSWRKGRITSCGKMKLPCPQGCWLLLSKFAPQKISCVSANLCLYASKSRWPEWCWCKQYNLWCYRIQKEVPINWRSLLCNKSYAEC